MATHFKTCLLIDDNYIDNFVTRRVLENGNFADKVIVLQSAGEAINALETGQIKPDIIFLDIRMPVMGGFEFLQAFDKLNIAGKKNIRIFMLSSSLDPTDIRKSVTNKYITDFIYKPLTQKTLDEINT